MKRFLLRLLSGFPLPRLIAEKDRVILEQARRIRRLERRLEEKDRYIATLVSASLNRNYTPLVQGGEASSPAPSPPLSPSLDFEGWVKRDEQEEIEAIARQAAGNPVAMEYYEEAAKYDPAFLPIVERAKQMRGQ